MNFFHKLIFKSDFGKQISILCAFLLNTIVVSFFIMTISGLDNIINDKLSNNDMQQILSIISSIISTGIITILFLQWIIWTLYKALLDSRNNFNTTMRMIGMPNKKIFNVYFREFVILQLSTVPFSIIFSWLFYYMITKTYNFSSDINIFSIFTAIMINFIISFCSLYISYIKNNKNIFYYSRSSGKTKNKISNSNLLYKIRIVCGILILLVLIFLSFSGFLQPYYYSLFLLPIVLIIDEVINLLCSIINISFPAKYNIIINLIKGNKKSIKIISYTMIFGLTLVFGIKSIIITSRSMAYNLVIENISYDKVLISQDFFDDSLVINSKHDINTAMMFNDNTIGSSKLAVMSITSEYIDQFEKFDFRYSNITKEDFKQKLNDVEFNGIILPEVFISQQDIGNTITLSLNNKKIDFVIVAGYYCNDYSTMFAFASKQYIGNILSMENKSNVAYIKDNEEISQLNSITNKKIITKNELANDSYNKVVQSTFILEITSLIVLLASFFMLGNYIYISAGQDKMNIARMRCLGLSKQHIDIVYIFSYITIILISAIIALFSAYSFGITFIYLMLGELFLLQGLLFSWIPYFLVILIYCVTSISLYLLITRTTISKYLSLIRVKIQKN